MWVMHRDWGHLPKPEYIRTPQVYTLVVLSLRWAGNDV